MPEQQDITYWRKLAGAMSRGEFAEDHPYPFLLRKRMAHTMPQHGVVTQPVNDWDDNIQFSTDVVDLEQVPQRSAGRIAGSKVVPIVKSARNPFAGQISVGRAKNCDIILRDASVSKHHAYFRVLEPHLADLVDMKSQNTTRLNGGPLRPGEATRVSPGDTILFGLVVCLFLDAQALYRML